jgi:hypothetical protein
VSALCEIFYDTKYIGRASLNMTMLVKGKAAGSLLLILVICSGSSGSLLSLSSVRGGTGGCPIHRHSSPSPSPVDHTCCQSRYEAAVLQKPVIPSHDTFVSPLPISRQKPALPARFEYFRSDGGSPGTPPSKLQLRI